MPTTVHPAEMEDNKFTTKTEEIDLQDDRNERLKINLWNQFDALFRKSATFQWRQYGTNLCQILFPLLIIILFYLLQQLVNDFISENFEDTPELLHPPTKQFSLRLTDMDIRCPPIRGMVPPIPETRPYYYVDETGNDASELMNFTEPFNLFKGRVYVERGGLQEWCERIDFPTTLTPQSVPTTSEYNDFLFNSWGNNEQVGGSIFRDYTPARLDVSVVYNHTLTAGLDVPLVLDFISQMFLWKINGSSMIMDGYRDMPTRAKKAGFDLISLLGPYLYVFIFQLIFPVILGSLVYEKEHGLREIMRMMGLNMTIYWIINYIFSLALYLIAFFLMWGMASALDFRYFVVNSSSVIFLHFFIWGNVLVAFSFFLSTFFGRSRTATIVGYIWVFITGILAGQVIQQFFDDKDTPRALVGFLQCIPQFALFRGLLILSNAVSFEKPGLAMDKVGDRGMSEVWTFLVVEWAIFLLLGFYFEQIWGVGRHPLFFTKKSFWTGSKEHVLSELKSTVEGESRDVAEHRRSLVDGKVNYYLRVEDLRKVYPKSGETPEKVAVKSLALGVKQGECLGFLGPNGAGKSTTINILSGLYQPTSGTAFVDDLDIRTNIDEVHMLMGVCPQDNLLWERLTGPEHLRFYGRLKNLKGKALDRAIEDGMKSVNLWDDRTKQSRQYSGGMKRRLSVACSLIGNPKLILLDEPSTGLDPASRRALWELINKKKKECTMLLTTHAMEEADALCDTIGIFAGGELKCLGSSTELKARYGKGFKLTITADPKRDSEVQSFLKRLAADAVLLNSIAGTSNYELPKSSVKLSRFFSEIEENKDKAGIIDWGLSNTTLEEVFLKTTGDDETDKPISVHIQNDNEVEMSNRKNKDDSDSIEMLN